MIQCNLLMILLYNIIVYISVRIRRRMGACVLGADAGWAESGNPRRQVRGRKGQALPSEPGVALLILRHLRHLEIVRPGTGAFFAAVVGRSCGARRAIQSPLCAVWGEIRFYHELERLCKVRRPLQNQAGGVAHNRLRDRAAERTESRAFRRFLCRRSRGHLSSGEILSAPNSQPLSRV